MLLKKGFMPKTLRVLRQKLIESQILKLFTGMQFERKSTRWCKKLKR